MKRLREKLHSERGASILLALLLFLVCCMVAASVLAAAASNAGKARSNRVEQQKYLTLSSAIQLICDELGQAEYTGRYKIYEWDVTTPAKIDAEGNIIEPAYTNYYFYCEQTPGTFTCDQLTKQIPLCDALDGIFSKQFTGAGYQGLTPVSEPSTTHTLTVTLPSGLVGYPYPADPSDKKTYEADQAVTVQVKLDRATRHITVTAWLGGGDAPANGSDTMIAELVASDAPGIVYDPVGRTPGSGLPEADTGTVVEDAKDTDPMAWHLNWIKKGAS